MDYIDREVIEKIRKEQSHTPIRKERKLPNGNMFYYNYLHMRYVLANRHGALLRLFETEDIESMNDERFIDFLVGCNKYNG